MTSAMRDLYNRRVEQKELSFDPIQFHAVQTMDDFAARLPPPAKSGLFGRARRKGAAETDKVGLYLHGPVGRGKTMMMDMFMQSLPPAFRARRVHFHDFMREVHDTFHARRKSAAAKKRMDDLLPSLAKTIAADTDILCFDEFQVYDVADAMILSRLFTALFDRGLVVVMTSNVVPGQLYQGGLQRDLFLPFIDLIGDRMIVLPVAGPRDYRVGREGQPGLYLYPLSPETFDEADALFGILTGGAESAPAVIRVRGRDVTVPQQAAGVARFTFFDLCETSLGAEDYAVLASQYHTFFLERVPRLDDGQRNEAKRLMTLIDVLYDRKRKLVVTAETLPDHIYGGSDHKNEFARTVSRLQEMQSGDYWVS